MRSQRKMFTSQGRLFSRGAAAFRSCSWAALLVLGAGTNPVAASQAALGHGAAARVMTIQHYATLEGVRVVVRLNSAIDYAEGTANDPYRIFFDLQGARPAEGLVSRTVVDDPYVRRIRIGEHEPGITRLVLDLDRPAAYTASFEDNPPRLVIEVSRRAAVLQAGIKLPSPAAASRRSLHNDRSRVSPRQDTIPQESSQESPPVPMPEQVPPKSPEVTYANGMLTIIAENSTLGEVLQAVAAQTGSTLDAPASLTGERMAARLGPGPPREVLSGLLSGPGLGYILLGDDVRPDEIRGIVLMASDAAADAVPSPPRAAPVNPVVTASGGSAQPITEQQFEEAAVQNQQQLEQQPSAEAVRPAAANPGSPADAAQQQPGKTQEQKLMEDLLRTMRQKDEPPN